MKREVFYAKQNEIIKIEQLYFGAVMVQIERLRIMAGIAQH
jgi:hypothetical protein